MMRRAVALIGVAGLLIGGASIGATRAEAAVGAEHCPEISHSVLRLYRAYFTRDPDAGGFGYWLQQYMSGTPLTAISDAFTHTPEFTSRYSGVDNAGFVRLVYENVLQRQPDQAGLDYWTAQLNARRLVRGGVMVLFSESPEFVSRTQTVAPATVPAGTLLYCGFGDDVIQITTPGGTKGAIFVAYMEGRGNNAVISRGPGFSYNDLLVNEIGGYLGERLMDLSPYEQRSESLEISNDGRWIFQIRPLSTVQWMGPSMSGSGDRVVYFPGRPSVGRFTHNGRSNFIVEAVTSGDWDLVVNEIGVYDGRRPVGLAPAFIGIQADGQWTVTIPG
jgi:hypothetical protein